MNVEVTTVYLLRPFGEDTLCAEAVLYQKQAFVEFFPEDEAAAWTTFVHHWSRR